MECPLCNSNNCESYCHPYRGRQIYLCKNCTNAFTYPPPESDYENDTFYEGSINDQVLYRRYAHNILSFTQKHIRKGKLLDIGTGGGYVLEEARKIGFTIQGIDASNGSVAYCKSRGLSVIQGYLKDKLFKHKHFDCIIASHVLEHVPEVNNFIKNVHKILKDDGIFILAQTNFQGTIPRMLGKYWEGWVPNQHFYHFSKGGIKNTLQNNGFETFDIRILPLGYTLRWMWGGPQIVANNLYNNINWTISKGKIGFPFIGDQMYVAAKKTNRQRIS